MEKIEVNNEVKVYSKQIDSKVAGRDMHATRAGAGAELLGFGQLPIPKKKWATATGEAIAAVTDSAGVAAEVETDSSPVAEPAEVKTVDRDSKPNARVVERAEGLLPTRMSSPAYERTPGLVCPP